MYQEKKKFYRLHMWFTKMKVEIKENWKYLLLIGIGVAGWSIGSSMMTKNLYANTQIVLSQADYFTQIDAIGSKGMVLFPLALILYMQIIGHNSMQEIVRNHSRVWVIGKEFGKVIWTSLYLTGIEILTMLLYIKILGLKQVNWTNKNSLFHFETGQILQQEPSFAKIVFFFFLSCFFGFFMIGIFYTFTAFCFGKKYIAIIIEIFIFIFLIKKQEAFGSYGIQAQQWIATNIMRIFIDLVLIVTMIVMSVKWIYRKDFYDS